MTLQDWSRFQDAIERLRTTNDRPLPALLVRQFLAGGDLVLLAGEQLERFEAASPGGWANYPEAQQDRWIFLAGDRSLVDELGLTIGAN